MDADNSSAVIRRQQQLKEPSQRSQRIASTSEPQLEEIRYYSQNKTFKDPLQLSSYSSNSTISSWDNARSMIEEVKSTEIKLKEEIAMKDNDLQKKNSQLAELETLYKTNRGLLALATSNLKTERTKISMLEKRISAISEGIMPQVQADTIETNRQLCANATLLERLKIRYDEYDISIDKMSKAQQEMYCQVDTMSGEYAAVEKAVLEMQCHFDSLSNSFNNREKNLEKALSESRSKTLEQTEELEQLTSNLDRVSKNAKTLQDDLNNIKEHCNVESIEDVCDYIDALRIEMSLAKAANSNLNDSIVKLKNEIENGEQASANLKGQLENYQQQLKEQQNCINTKNCLLEKLQSQLTELHDSAAAINVGTAFELHSAVTEACGERDELTAKLLEVTRKKEELIQNLTDTKEKLHSTVDSIERRFQESQKALVESHTTEIAAVIETSDKLKEQIAQCNRIIEGQKVEIAEHDATLERYRLDNISLLEEQQEAASVSLARVSEKYSYELKERDERIEILQYSLNDNKTKITDLESRALVQMDLLTTEKESYSLLNDNYAVLQKKFCELQQQLSQSEKKSILESSHDEPNPDNEDKLLLSKSYVDENVNSADSVVKPPPTRQRRSVPSKRFSLKKKTPRNSSAGRTHHTSTTRSSDNRYISNIIGSVHFDNDIIIHGDSSEDEGDVYKNEENNSEMLSKIRTLKHSTSKTPGMTIEKTRMTHTPTKYSSEKAPYVQAMSKSIPSKSPLHFSGSLPRVSLTPAEYNGNNAESCVGRKTITTTRTKTTTIEGDRKRSDTSLSDKIDWGATDPFLFSSGD